MLQYQTEDSIIQQTNKETNEPTKNDISVWGLEESGVESVWLVVCGICVISESFYLAGCAAAEMEGAAGAAAVSESGACLSMALETM